MLLDRCPHCAAPVSFFRMDMGRGANDVQGDALAVCYRCTFDLATAPRVDPPVYELEAFAKFWHIIKTLDEFSNGRCGQIDVDELAVLRHLVMLMLSRRRHVQLRAYLAEIFGVVDPVTAITRRTAFESLPVGVRHVLLQWGAWLLNEPKTRLGDAVRRGGILYNHLLRDFELAPRWYSDFVATSVQRRCEVGHIFASK